MADPAIGFLVEYLKEVGSATELNALEVVGDLALLAQAVKENIVSRIEENGKVVYTLPVSMFEKEGDAIAQRSEVRPEPLGDSGRLAAPRPREQTGPDRRSRVVRVRTAQPPKIREPRFDFSPEAGKTLALVTQYRVVSKEILCSLAPAESIEDLRTRGFILEWPNSTGGIYFLLVSDGTDTMTRVGPRELPGLISCISYRLAKDSAHRYRELIADHKTGACGCSAAWKRVRDGIISLSPPS